MRGDQTQHSCFSINHSKFPPVSNRKKLSQHLLSNINREKHYCAITSFWEHEKIRNSHTKEHQMCLWRGEWKGTSLKVFPQGSTKECKISPCREKRKRWGSGSTKYLGKKTPAQSLYHDTLTLCHRLKPYF